uniref:Putative ATPase domain containing protein n=1 Tax=viral metagenome TaxID=1070528 RepID=A0A6H1ZS26_9ZZZZ
MVGLSNQGFWVVDPETGEDRFALYSELEADVVQAFIKPVGGFIFPAGMFMLSGLPDAPFYVKDWLPKRGKSLLYAPAKAGKSFLSMQLSRCIGAGLPFLGLTTIQAKVLYIQFELGEEILQGRLKATGKEYENVWVGTTFSLKLDTTEGKKRLRTAMEAVEPNVLILDPLYKAIIGEENDSHDIREVLDFLDEIIEMFNCSIFLIHHAGYDISKRARGSTVFEDWVDSYIQMRRTSKKGEILKVKIEPIFLRHAPLPEEPILAELGEDFEFHTIGGEPTVKERVAEFIRVTRAEVTPKQLFAQGIGSNTSVYESLGELEKEGKVEKVGRGLYCWR